MVRDDRTTDRQWRKHGNSLRISSRMPTVIPHNPETDLHITRVFASVALLRAEPAHNPKRSHGQRQRDSWPETALETPNAPRGHVARDKRQRQPRRRDESGRHANIASVRSPSPCRLPSREREQTETQRAETFRLGSLRSRRAIQFGSRREQVEQIGLRSSCLQATEDHPRFITPRPTRSPWPQPPQHFLNFFPLPHGQGALRPTRCSRTIGAAASWLEGNGLSWFEGNDLL